MASENLVTLSDETFDAEIINSELPSVVDFWAEWCMPCKMLAPTLHELAGEYADRVKFAKVDTDECRTTAQKYGISAIPTLIFFKGGQPVKKVIGLQQKRQLKEAIDAMLAG